MWVRDGAIANLLATQAPKLELLHFYSLWDDFCNEVCNAYLEEKITRRKLSGDYRDDPFLLM